jgi:hypothetical protein
MVIGDPSFPGLGIVFGDHGPIAADPVNLVVPLAVPDIMLPAGAYSGMIEGHAVC